MKQFFFGLILLTGFAARAQDVTTVKLQFNSDKYTDMANRLPQVGLNRIVIDKKNQLTWKDGHDVTKYTLDIKAIAGALNVSGSGQIVYQLSSQTIKGRATVKKNNGVIKISLLLIEEGSPLSIEFEGIAYTIID